MWSKQVQKPNQSGGVRKDLFKDEYHGSLEDKVAKPPINDAEYVAAAKRRKDTILFLSIKVLYIKSVWIIKLFG